MQLILASNSPRRKQLLTEYGFNFKVIPSSFEEINAFSSPIDLAKNNALGKATEVFTQNPESVVLGADTIVVLDNKVLGKPKDELQAKSMLNSLSNKTHLVITGYAILSKGVKIVDSVITKVVFNDLSNALINEYVKTGSPLDKAGAYGIQDGFSLVKSIDGSFNNVVGLPIEIIKEKLLKILK